MQANKVTQLPSRCIQAAAMRDQGCPPQAIANKMGVSTQAAVQMVDQADRLRDEIADTKSRRRRTMRLIKHLNTGCFNSKAVADAAGIGYGRLRQAARGGTLAWHEITALEKFFLRVRNELIRMADPFPDSPHF